MIRDHCLNTASSCDREKQMTDQSRTGRNDGRSKEACMLAAVRKSRKRNKKVSSSYCLYLFYDLLWFE
jgi:hypothetical protein